MRTTQTDYETQALEFMARWGIEFKAKRGADKCPPFCEGKHIHGDQYRVTLRRTVQNVQTYRGQEDGAMKVGDFGEDKSLTFPFWNSLNDSQAGKQPTAYDVLTCCGSDLSCPETFYDFCAEYGYNIDSRIAHATFKRCAAFGKKLRTFFDNEEMQTELQTIN